MHWATAVPSRGRVENVPMDAERRVRAHRRDCGRNWSLFYWAVRRNACMHAPDVSIRLHTCTVPRFGRTRIFWSYLGSILISIEPNCERERTSVNAIWTYTW